MEEDRMGEKERNGGRKESDPETAESQKELS